MHRIHNLAARKCDIFQLLLLLRINRLGCFLVGYFEKPLKPRNIANVFSHQSKSNDWFELVSNCSKYELETITPWLPMPWATNCIANLQCNADLWQNQSVAINSFHDWQCTWTLNTSNRRHIAGLINSIRTMWKRVVWIWNMNSFFSNLYSSRDCATHKSWCL